MRSAFQQKLWEELDKEKPEPVKDWLLFDCYEFEVEEKYGTLFLDDGTCLGIVREVTGRTPLEAHYDPYMNGIEYLYEEDDE